MQRSLRKGGGAGVLASYKLREKLVFDAQPLQGRLISKNFGIAKAIPRPDLNPEFFGYYQELRRLKGALFPETFIRNFAS